jgi:AmmeMemoRadiSam system radical SAM enzyme
LSNQRSTGIYLKQVQIAQTNMSNTEANPKYVGRYWHHVEDNSAIHCDLCPRACVLKEGDRGFCFVRKNEEGLMRLTTYGKSTGFCIDPIEKKPLAHFLPGTSVLSFGTAGCNLGCQFCQNWSISKSREIEILSEDASPETIAQAAQRLGCRSVAFTYNDPVIWAEYAIDTAKACHAIGLKTVAVTAGYITPEARPEFYSVMDAANVDLKAFSETFYKKITLSNLAPVLDTLKWLKHESDVWFEITNLMIPDENDAPEETEAMCEWIVNNLGDEVPVHFTAFHPDFRMMDKGPTPPETLSRARQIAIRAGIKFAYVGNVHDQDGDTTYCPQCKATLIVRDWYEIKRFNLKNGCCKKCGKEIPGLFEATCGDWGRRRVGVRLT